MKKIHTYELKPGDILIQSAYEVDRAEELKQPGIVKHCMMWCVSGMSNPKAIIHSVDGVHANGILRNTTEKALQGTKNFVFRFEDRSLAAQAAEYAKVWALTSGPQVSRYSRNHELIRQKKIKRGTMELQSIPLSTPFGSKPLVKSLQDKSTSTWNDNAFLKAFQAYIRGESRKPLSNNIGVFCSQFILCCYQAAAIKLMLKNKRTSISNELIRQSISDPSGLSLKSSGLISRIIPFKDEIETEIPESLRIFAKKSILSTMVESFLSKPDQVSFLGQLI